MDDVSCRANMSDLGQRVVDGGPRPSPLILCQDLSGQIQIPVLVASSRRFSIFQLEYSLELVSMYSICLDITSIYPMRAWRTSFADQPKPERREPLLYCTRLSSTGPLFHIAFLQHL